MSISIKQHCKNATKRIVTVTVYRHGVRYTYQRPIWVDCGQCEFCRRKKQKEWASRLNIEMERFYRDNPNGAVYYFTLTISPDWFKANLDKCLNDCDDMPIPFITDKPFDENDYMVTPVAKNIYRNEVKAHLIDLLRSKKGANLKDMKYYVCCEFGDQKERIHFHGYFFIDDYNQVSKFCCDHGIKPCKAHRVNCKSVDGGRIQNKDERYFQALLERYWRCGFVEKVSRASARTSFYITKYVTKIKADIDANKMPFHHQSNELGLLEDSICSAILNNKPYFTWKRFGKEYKIPISKYYRAKYAELLGYRDEQRQQFVNEARKIFLDRANEMNRYDLDLPFAFDGKSYDVLDNEIVRTQYLHYICNTQYRINRKTRLIEPYDTLIPIIEQEIVTINNIVQFINNYEQKRNESQLSEAD